MDKLVIISRIKALLAIGDSSRNPYEEEVKTALKMAQDLIEYQKGYCDAKKIKLNNKKEIK